MDKKLFTQIQLEALSVRYYIIAYDELEQEIKRIFFHSIDDISEENKNLLYFYLAGIKSNCIQIEYGNRILSPQKVQFSSAENFSILSTSQILKIQRQNRLLNEFDFTIQSINQKSAEYTFSDCCNKLLNMRNKLAHEMSHLTFSNKEVIELLSNDYISKKSDRWFSSLDFELMNDETKCIFSNLIIMENIIANLRERDV